MTKTILFSSAGRRVHLMQCFREDAKRLGVKLRVLATDLQPELSAACQQADEAFKIPRCTTPEFVPAMIELCRQQQVALLVPTIDTELVILSENTAQFAAIGTRIIISAPTVVALANSKLTTAERLMAAGIPAAKTLLLADYLRNTTQLRQPVIAKPNAGSASIGIVKPKHLQELSSLNPQGYIVQELWQGKEYTVNVFCDQSGQLRCVVPHKRIEVRAGEVSKGITCRMPALENVADMLVQAIPGMVGPWCFQAMVTDSDEFAVFEINARFGGGYPLAHRAGARFSQWLLEESCARPLSASNIWKEGVTMLRYDAAVFLND